MTTIGEYVLDTLQIYFPWDDDLYTYLKEGGLGEGDKAKAVPLIYTDNCESTEGKAETPRKFVREPEYLGKTHTDLGWKDTGKRAQPIIPAEKTKVRISLEESDSLLKFRIIPEQNQYHLEHTVSTNPKMFLNWVGLYLPTGNTNLSDLCQTIENRLGHSINPNASTSFLVESQDKKREEMTYVKLPLTYYEFSLEEFDCARDYLTLNGFKGQIPKLVFDSSKKKYTSIMNPVIKFGIVCTTAAQGYTNREPQIVMKISQDIITKSKRGLDARAKGLLSIEKGENFFLVETESCVQSAKMIIDLFKKKYPKKQI